MDISAFMMELFLEHLKNGHGCTVEALLEKDLRILYGKNDIELLLAEKRDELILISFGYIKLFYY